MLGILDAASSVLGGALGGGSEPPQMSTATTGPQTFSSGSMTSTRISGGWIALAIVVLLYLVGGRRHG